MEQIEHPAVELLHARGREPLAAISGRAPPLLGREDAVGQATVIEALYEAAAGGAKVQVG